MFSRDSSGASPLRIARRREGKRKKWEEKKEGEGGKEKKPAHQCTRYVVAVVVVVAIVAVCAKGKGEKERANKKAVRITAAPMR